jgi:ATP-binding cassette subfamily C (CFTR/MRP) protein 10
MVASVLLLAIFSRYGLFTIQSSTLELLLYYALTKISLFRDLTLSMTTCERELISYERIRKYMQYQPEMLNFTEEVQFKSDEPIL